ncbi:helix-turn-helix domain-containing protein [Cohnella sp. 56]|uniref:helix-turn-helix domain-containing protein n=1 Tax=Cohnella sp. 56 TaxID=3113722 RepID=UPI0030EABF51
MFLKKQTVRKNGKTYCYYRIVSAYRDDEGRTRHRTERYIGALSDEAAAELRKRLQGGAHSAAGSAAGLRKQLRDGAYSAAGLDAGLHKQPREGVRGAAAEPAGRVSDRHTAAAGAASAFLFRDMSEIVYAPWAPWEWNVTDSDVLLLVRDGQGELRIRGRKHALRAGSVIFCPAGRGIHIGNPFKQRLTLDKIAFVSVEHPAVSGIRPEEGDGAPVRVIAAPWRANAFAPASPERIARWVRQLRSASTDSRGDPIGTQLAFYQILGAVFEPGAPAAEDGGAAGWIDEAIRLIRACFHEPLSRDRTAAALGISPAHFSRLFRRETGCSFVDYVCRTRIRHAQELLLLSPDKSIGEIAESSGFQSEHYFSRKFKQAKGCSPTAYRLRPRSYAALSPHIASCLLTLGVVPRVGVLEPWMEDVYGRRLSLNEMRVFGELGEEALRALEKAQPDLILAGEGDAHWEQLREIAPVIAVPDLDDDWREPLFLIANAAGLRDRAAAWADRFDRLAAEARLRLSRAIGPDDTVGIVKIVSDKLYVYGRSTSMGGCVIYDTLGLRAPAAVRDELFKPCLPNKPIEPHELPHYAGDRLFLFDYRSKWYPDKPGWMQSDAWLALTAVRNGHVYMPNPDLFYSYDPLSLELQLEHAVSMLTSHSG